MRLPFVLLALAVVAARPTAADPMKLPTVDYVADVVMPSAPGGPINMRIFSSKNRFRADIHNNLILLADADARVSVAYAPMFREYTVMPWERFDVREVFGVTAEKFEAVGTETLLDRTATKYKVRGQFRRQPFEGYVWSTDDNITVRVEGVRSADKPVLLMTVRLDTAPLAPDVFAVPTAFKKVENFSQMVLP